MFPFGDVIMIGWYNVHYLSLLISSITQPILTNFHNTLKLFELWKPSFHLTHWWLMIWIEFRCEINWWLPTSIQSSFHIAFLSHNVLFVLPILMQYMYGVVRELIRLNRIGALISSAICAQLLIAALQHKCWQHHKHGFDINDLSNDLIRAQWYKWIFGMDLHLNTIFPNPCYHAIDSCFVMPCWESVQDSFTRVFYRITYEY